MNFKEKYFGDKAFFRTLFAVLIPIVIQNTFNNFVNLLDNVMVGRLGTEAMSGVSVANSLFFVFYLAIFGVMSGAGIYGAQYAGKKDWQGVRITFRYKLVAGTLLCLGFLALLYFKGEDLILLYLTDDGTSDLGLTLSYSRAYMLIIFFQMLPNVFVQAYATTLRETGETKLPMYAGIAAVVTNFVLNYILIFGKFGAPALGVRGAAIATVVSRFVELAIIIAGTVRRRDTLEWPKGLLFPFVIPGREALAITKQGLALMINETMWSLGNTVLMQFYSTRGLSVVAALNIANTVNNLFMVSVISCGSAVGIIIGQLLGAGKVEEAKETDRKLIFFSVFLCVCVALVMGVAAPFIPYIYKTEDAVRTLATRFLWVQAVFLVMDSYFNACYFTLRAGGNTLVTIIFDSGHLWAIVVPIGFVLAYYTELPILMLFVLVQLPYLMKIFIGTYLLRRGTWARSLVEEQDA